MAIIDVINAMMAIMARSGRRLLGHNGIIDKGRPEQGIIAAHGRIGTVLSDTGCGLEGADQRGHHGLFDRAGDEPGACAHRCSRE